MAGNKLPELDDKSRAVLLASRIELLFGFCAELIPDKDLLEAAIKETGDRANFSLSAAPILGAMGMDYEEKTFEWNLRQRRAKAILHLIKELEATEKDRKAFEEHKGSTNKELDFLKQYLG